MGEGERHRRKPLRRRVDDDHRVSFPRLAGPPVSNAAPQVDNLLAVAIDAAAAAKFVAGGEILDERVLHPFEAGGDVSLDLDSARSGYQHEHDFTPSVANAAEPASLLTTNAASRVPQGHRRICCD